MNQLSSPGACVLVFVQASLIQLGSLSHSVHYKAVGCYEDCTEAANLNRCMSATTKSAGDRKIEAFFPSFFFFFANKRLEDI